jgi:A/G-specific adenine glycosylase
VTLIKQMANELVVRFSGLVPRERADLLSLPGVSDYIASAVRCFAWNEPEALLDTNTVRVVGRLFGLHIRDSSRRNRRFRELLTLLVDPAEPRAYNYALLDLGSQCCTARRPPDCLACPAMRWCTHTTQVVGPATT